MGMEQATNHLTPELDYALNSLETELANMGDREKVILSDFDYTLCDSYVFDEGTNNHIADIDPDVVAAAQTHHLVVATSRRVDNPTVPLLWESGLVQRHTPVIVENGGAILFLSESGSLECIDLVRPEDMEQLGAVRQLVGEAIRDLPAGQQLIFKVGRTMLLARLQDDQGTSLPHHQQWLAERIRGLMPPSSLQVVDTRASVTIQHEDVNKGEAFRRYLGLVGVPRDSIYVIGMGDGENDAEIFDEADLSLGFSDSVSHMVDIDVPLGPQAIPHVLGVISEGADHVRQLALR